MSLSGHSRTARLQPGFSYYETTIDQSVHDPFYLWTCPAQQLFPV